MKTTILFLVLVIASSYAMKNSNGFLTLDQRPDLNDMLNQLKGTSLGRSVSTLLRLKLRTSDQDYTRLFAAFDQLREFLENAKLHNVEMAGTRLETNTLVNTNEWTIQQEQQDIIVPGAVNIRNMGNQLTTKQNLFATNEATCAMTSSTLETLHVDRALVVAQFEIDRTKIVLAIQGCSQALECLARLKLADNTFIQLAEEKKNYVSNIAMAAQNLGAVTAFKKEARMIKFLVQMTQSDEAQDDEKLQEVMDLIARLKDDLWIKLNDCDGARVTQEKLYTDTVEALTAVLTTCQSDNVALTLVMASLQTEITNEEQAVISAENARDESFTREQNEATNYAAYVDTLIANNEQIDWELSILDQAEGVLATEGINRPAVI